jgi:hypothetical protein
VNQYELAGSLLDRNLASLKPSELALLTVVADKFKSHWDNLRSEWESRSGGRKISASVNGKIVDVDYMTRETASYEKSATLLGKKELMQITKHSVNMKAVKTLTDTYKKLLDGGAITSKTSVCVEVKDEKAGK